MTTRQFSAYVLGLMAFTCYVGTAQAEKPIRWTDDFSVEIGATEEWSDFFGYTQACGFDFKVVVYDRFTVHVFDDREIWNILIRDTYTNLATGFSFEDFASYVIIFDYQTGLADHRGVFWRTRIPGTGMVLLDVGGFLQDWYDANWPIFPGSLVGNNHDVNGPYSEGIFPPVPVSYCDLMAEIFPE